jgi:hypothetical protein
LVKHAGRLAGQSNKALSCLVVPYTWLYRVILPFFIPLADYFFLISYFILGNKAILKYYLLCLLADLVSGIFILIQKRERINFLELIVLQRYFRHLTCITYFSIFLRWINGSLYGWHKIPRQGNVKLDS